MVKLIREKVSGSPQTHMEAEGSFIKYDVRTTRESHRVSQVKRVHEKEGGGERGAGLMYYVHTYVLHKGQLIYIYIQPCRVKVSFLRIYCYTTYIWQEESMKRKFGAEVQSSASIMSMIQWWSLFQPDPITVIKSEMKMNFWLFQINQKDLG